MNPLINIKDQIKRVPQKVRISFTFLTIGLIMLFGILKFSTVFRKALKDLKKVEANELPATKLLPEEYLNLFTKEALNNIKVNSVRNSKVRSPVASIDYKKKFVIYIYKINMVRSDVKIDTMLHQEIKNLNELPSGPIYNGIEDIPTYGFQYKADAEKEISNNIYLTFSGDSLKRFVKNDNIVGFYLLLNNFSARYSKDDLADVLIGVDEEAKNIRKRNIPIDILFVKKSKTLYLLTLLPINRNDNINYDELYNTISLD
jgi:hypothetical protein